MTTLSHFKDMVTHYPGENSGATSADPQDNGTLDETNNADANWYSYEYPDIQPYTDEQIKKVVEIAPAPGKGNCMYIRHSYEPGVLILVEKPLFVIVPDTDKALWSTLHKLNEQQTLQMSPLWHQAALLTVVTGTPEKIEIMKGKWVLDKNPSISEDVYRILEATCVMKKSGEFVYSNGVVVDPHLYQYMLQVWPLNAFGHTSDPNGLIIYNNISYLAHSCDASACWHHYGDDLFMLRSRRKLKPGDELTISYLGEADLLSPTHKRRELLRNWSFHCECARCSITIDRARSFLCKFCHFGMIDLYIDRATNRMNSLPCSLCEYKYNEQDISEYMELEQAYITRIETIDPADMDDIQLVYRHAKNVFKNHWCLYQLQSLLYECYKERGSYDQAKYYMQQRLHYTEQVMKRPLYCVAFMYEELADLLLAQLGISTEEGQESSGTIDIDILNTVMDTYFRTAALLAILTGYHHPYYYNVVNKRYKVEMLLNRILEKMITQKAMRCFSGFKETLSWLCCHFLRENSNVEDFKKCCEVVAIRRAAGDISDDDFWNLYGYFKQAVVGDYNVVDTSDATESDLLKWAYWKKRKGMSKRNAMAAYIDIVREKYGNFEDEEKNYANVNTVYSKIQRQQDDDFEGSSLPAEGGDLLTLAAENRLEMIQTLLKAKPHLISSKTDEGLTALHLAADRGHVEVAQFLLEKGAEIDAVDDHMDTPLLVAAAAENMAMVDLLISRGANTNLRNMDGVSFQDLLPEYGNI